MPLKWMFISKTAEYPKAHVCTDSEVNKAHGGATAKMSETTSSVLQLKNHQASEQAQAMNLTKTAELNR